MSELPVECCADTILLNGKIVTMDTKNTITEAVAIKNGKILKVGTNEEVKALAGGKTQITDLRGKTVLPGFIDTHIHLSYMWTIGLYTLDLSAPPIKSLSGMLEKIGEKARKTPAGQWIVAQGVTGSDFNLIEKRYPNRWEIDKVAPNNPVFLDFYHIHVANSEALRLAGITKETLDPAGGKIERDPATGEPNGFLCETAGRLVKRLVPPCTVDQIKDGIKKGATILLEAGITTIHDIVGDVSAPVSIPMKAYQELLESDELPIRVHMIVRTIESDVDVNTLLKLGIRTGFGNDWLKIGGLKMFADGGGISRTAALSEPYNDQPENRGVLFSMERLTEEISKAHKAGLRCCVHAIGDRAIDMLLDIYEDVLKEMTRKNHRHRIEHGGNLFYTLERRERVKRLGIVLDTNPAFIPCIGDNYKIGLGPERVKGAFPYKTFAEEGILAAAGSDWPSVKAWKPLEGVWACIARTTWGGHELSPEERVSRMDAIRLYTTNAAYAGFEEDIKGSIEPNKLADLVILSDDPLTVPTEKIKDIKVETTFMNGKIVYQR